MEECYRRPKPECTGGITNASVFFCECDDYDAAVNSWVPLEEKIRQHEYNKIKNLRAPELYIGTFKEDDGKLIADKEAERWIRYNTDLCSLLYWKSYRVNPERIRRPTGSWGEKSILTDMTPMPEYPAKRREAEWGDWPRERIYETYGPNSIGRISSMMTRYVEAAMASGIKPMNINMRENIVLNSKN